MSERERLRLQKAVEEQSNQRVGVQQADMASEHEQQINESQSPAHNILGMQRTHGNQAVQRYLGVQRSTLEEGGPLNSEVSQRINSKRGAGSSLDSSVQAEMSDKMNFDFSHVKVHTDSASDQLNQELGAKAFTTGSDVFFRGDSYNPGSSSGKELIAHELTHVVQQHGSSPGGDLTLGPANDSYESEADSMASQATSVPSGGVQTKREEGVQRMEEEEEAVQAKRDDTVQREAEEEEEMIQAKRDDTVQREAEDEELPA